MQLSRKRAYAHIIFWIAFVFCYPLFYNAIVIGNLDLYPLQILTMIITIFYLIPISYFIGYYLIPQFFIKKSKILSFIISYLVISIGILCIDLLVTRYIYAPRFNPELIDSFWCYALNLPNIAKQFFILQSQIFIFLAFRFFIQYIHNYIEKENLKHQIVENELNMLKGQIHPHFLFNTLNNIYMMSLDCNNDLLSESVARMSDILRFTLYECDTHLIPVSKELKIIKDYIYLEKLRYSDIKIDISVADNLDRVYITPLVLFPFIENAFKHGTSKTTKNKWISIHLYVENNRMHFNVKNSKKHNYNKSSANAFYNKSKGIGISNATKRLELFYGQNSFKLDISDSNTFFEVDLRINLSTNIDKAIV